jgi:hypothetical protein
MQVLINTFVQNVLELFDEIRMYEMWSFCSSVIQLKTTWTMNIIMWLLRSFLEAVATAFVNTK